MSEPVAFEARLARLEALVAALEGGQLSLENTLTAFEEGVGLARELGRELEAGQARVELLTKDSQGGVTLAPFEEGAGP